MAFQASVEAEKWARKDEAVYAVSLRLGFQGELNNGMYLWMFEAMDSSGSALQLLVEYPSVGSRVQSGVFTMAGGWQSALVEKA